MIVCRHNDGHTFEYVDAPGTFVSTATMIHLGMFPRGAFRGHEIDHNGRRVRFAQNAVLDLTLKPTSRNEEMVDSDGNIYLFWPSGMSEIIRKILNGTIILDGHGAMRGLFTFSEKSHKFRMIPWNGNVPPEADAVFQQVR